ncbi:MAG: PDZ domain-containing protein [Planctomycetales bacterium]|nr:PDZ domain-containing protein [Planctomycetales bacterium]
MKNLLRKLGMVGGIGSLALVSGPSAIRAEDPDEQIVVVTAQADEGEDGVNVKVVASASKYWLGVVPKSIDGDLADYLGTQTGVLIGSVMENGPAAKAGLQKGDILLSINGQELNSPQDLLDQLKDKTDESEINLSVNRKGETLALAVKLEERPKTARATAHTFSFSADSDLDDILKDTLGGGRELNVFRLGTPSAVWVPEGGDGSSANIDVRIVRSDDDENVMEITVKREGDKPAHVTVRKGEDVKEFDVNESSELPADVRELVGPMLGNQKRIIIRSDGKGSGFSFKSEVTPEIMEKLSGHFKDRAAEIAAQAHAEADRARAMAEKMAESARASAGVGQKAERAEAQIQELKAMIEDLRAELKLLREKTDK